MKKAEKYARLIRFRAKNSPCLCNVNIFHFLYTEPFSLKRIYCYNVHQILFSKGKFEQSLLQTETISKDFSQKQRRAVKQTEALCRRLLVYGEFLAPKPKSALVSLRPFWLTLMYLKKFPCVQFWFLLRCHFCGV